MYLMSLSLKHFRIPIRFPCWEEGGEIVALSQLLLRERRSLLGGVHIAKPGGYGLGRTVLLVLLSAAFGSWL